MGTFTSYQLIAKDLQGSLARKAAAPEVARETTYFQANIGKVKTVDDFFGDRRLYTYAMKAFGLEEMTYAKAFMRKVLNEGVSSSSSFANRLSDDRYVAFARAFDFTKGASATGTESALIEPTSPGQAPQLSARQAAQLSGAVDLAKSFDFSGTNEVSFTLSSQVDATTTKSASIVLSKKTLTAKVANLARVTGDEILIAINAQIAASGDANLKGKVQVGTIVVENPFTETSLRVLSFRTTAFASLGIDGVPGGTGPNADAVYAAGGTNRTIAIDNAPLSSSGQTALDIGFGTNLPPDAKAKSVTEAYLRQAIEDDAGAEDTGVRLALYFARMGPLAKSGFAILGDPALSQVIKTVLSLPDGGGSAEALARQAATIERKIDLKSFQDPAKLDQFVKRFTAIWDAQNASSSTGAPVLALFGNL